MEVNGKENPTRKVYMDDENFSAKRLNDFSILSSSLRTLTLLSSSLRIHVLEFIYNQSEVGP